MTNTNLILRTLISPFTTPFNDFTKGSVLSQADVDNNFIYLKGNLIYTATTSGNTVTLYKINGGTINFNVSGGSGTDTYVTGGTYNQLTGVATYTNNTGGTFSVTGFTTGSTDTYVTGLTFNNLSYILTAGRNDGVNLTANLAILASDVTITGGTYDSNTGVATFTNNSGASFTVNGFLTGFTDIYTTGGTFTAGTLTLFDNTGGTINITGFTTGGTGDILYTNTAATPTTIGGINAGSTFSAQTMQQMWDALLYPYQFPAFTSFSLGISSPREIGYDINTAQTFTWSTSNSFNVSANTIQIAGYNLTTLSGLANDGNEPVIFTGVVSRNATDAPGTRAWSIQGTNTKGGTFSTNLSIRWDWIMYAGTNISATLTASGITGLTDFNSVRNGFSGTYPMSAGGYKYFCFADGYGTPNTWVDTSNNLNVAMNPTIDGFYTNIDSQGNVYGLVSITNQFGETTNYRVYRTRYQLGGTITIAVN